MVTYEDFTNKKIFSYYFTPNFVTFKFKNNVKTKIKKQSMVSFLVYLIKSDADSDSIVSNKKTVERIIKELTSECGEDESVSPSKDVPRKCIVWASQ